MHHFTFKCLLGNQEGLPQIGLALVHGLMRAGVSFDLVPHRVQGELDGDTTALVRSSGTGPIVSYNDIISESCEANDVSFVMWETNKISQKWVTSFNKRKALIVPCEWNRDMFTSCGVNVPIHKCPLGIDPVIFSAVKELNDTPREHFTFGCGAQRYGLKWTRKNIPLIVEAFQKLPGDNLRLEVKVGSNFRKGEFPVDPRIKYIRDFFTPEKLAEWFRSLDCFVSASSTEGWGLFQHQALACGVPLIAVNYGGLTEFFRPPVAGLELDYTIEHPSAFYKGYGKWPMPTLSSLISCMEQIQVDSWHSEAITKTIEHLTTERMQQRFLSVLSELFV